MPNPTLLLERARAAVEDGNVPAFLRWTRHPRWHLGQGQGGSLVAAALASPAPVAWLTRLRCLGVDPLVGHNSLPSVWSAARTGDAATLEWLLAQGARPLAFSDFGLGSSAGRVALDAGHGPVVALLWRATGTLRGIMGHGERPCLLKAAAIPVLEHLVGLGWSVLTPESTEPSESPLGFLEWARDHAPRAHARQPDPALLAWAHAQALGQALPTRAGLAARQRL